MRFNLILFSQFRRLGGVDSLLECFASPSKGVQQASSFAMSQAAFDFEVRREMRAKDGIRPLAKLLQSDDAKVPPLASRCMHARAHSLRARRFDSQNRWWSRR